MQAIFEGGPYDGRTTRGYAQDPPPEKVCVQALKLGARDTSARCGSKTACYRFDGLDERGRQRYVHGPERADG